MQEEDNGGYVFISHSHKDIKKVRLLRNDLEDAGFEPLCFFLKCLSDDDEIEDLIKREIDSREWFVYADSPNSRASDWVKKEREYIEHLGNKKVVTIDLESNKPLTEYSMFLIKSLRAYIIHGTEDIDFAVKLADKLKENEFQVFVDGLLKDVHLDEIVNMTREINKCGIIIILLSKNSINNKKIEALLDISFSEGGVIIPVLIDDVEIKGTAIEFFLITTRWIKPKEVIQSENDMDNFVELVKDEVLKTINVRFDELNDHSWYNRVKKKIFK